MSEAKEFYALSDALIDAPDHKHVRVVMACQYDAVASRANDLEARLTAVTLWLEQNQPDVFRRGLWDAINAVVERVKP